MAKYKVKPVTVEAYQWDGTYDVKRDPKWITNAMKKSGDEVGAARMYGSRAMKIVGAGVILDAAPGDFIIRMPDDSLLIMKPAVFDQLFIES